MENTIKEAKKTIKSYEQGIEAEKLLNKVQKGQPTSKLVGHPNVPIRCIIDAGSHIVSGTIDGDVIGWAKPHYGVGFRFKAAEPLISLCKVTAPELLLAAGYSMCVDKQEWSHNSV